MDSLKFQFIYLYCKIETWFYIFLWKKKTPISFALALAVLNFVSQKAVHQLKQCPCCKNMLLSHKKYSMVNTLFRNLEIDKMLGHY